jgi:4-amino-4-deoxy-L-arabinose transferase-like glycosyltransferase
MPHLSTSGDEHGWSRRLQAGLWTLCGAIVLFYIFIAALGGIDPAEAKAATATVVVLAALWLAHSWRQLWVEEKLSHRRGGKRRDF